MVELNIDEINKAVKDSAYAAVGFGVLGFQRVQVQRRELIEQLQSASVPSQLDDARKQIEKLGKLIEEQFDPAREQLVSYVKQIEDQVGPAREQLVAYARKADEQVAPVRKSLENGLDEVEQRLPASTRNAFANLRKTVHGTEDRVRDVVGLSTTAPKAS